MHLRHVVVRAAAPIPVGQEIEVAQVELPGGIKVIRVRDLSTSVFYGEGNQFSATPAYELVGEARHFRSSRPPQGATLAWAFRARVVECVVTTAGSDQTPCTSFVVEVLAP